MLLHEAIDTLLAQHPGMTSRELAEQINRRKLYRRGDGEPIMPGQVSARVENKTYRDRYRKEDGQIFPVAHAANHLRGRTDGAVGAGYLGSAAQLPNACPQ